MTTTADNKARHLAVRERSRMGKNLMATLPIVLVGSMAVSMNLTGPLDTTEHKRLPKDKAQSPGERSQNQADDLAGSIRQALTRANAGTTDSADTTDGDVVVAAAPATYTVRAGDTVSSIAGRHGLSTASVLALNGLGWKSIIYPGQVLTLSKSGSQPITPAPQAPAATPSAPAQYTISSGDTIGKIAARHKISTESLLTANGLGWKSIIYPGQKITIPGQAAPATVAPPVTVVPPVTATPPVSTPPATSAYVIKSGDTIGSIAAKHGVTVQAMLNANGLSWSSIIYAGRTLTIPGAAVPAAAGSTITPMNAEMRANAATIVSVGKQLGVSDYGLVISLATAMQESTLRNLNWGDRDSLGLFQQRPSTGWGTPTQVTDPVYASRLFFGGPSNPNKGLTRGLLDIPGWQSMTVTQAAQAVQISGHPDAYAKWEASAWVWLDELT